MKVLLLIPVLALGGCICLDPNHRQVTPPGVTTEIVIKDLKDTQEELKKVGMANTQVGKSVDKALTLAERLDFILQEIEASQNKNVKKPQL